MNITQACNILIKNDNILDDFFAVDCGGTYTEPYGTIQTPTYPTSYHNEANCTWLITVAENRVVDLK